MSQQSPQGVTITPSQDGFVITGILDEYADFSFLLTQPEELVLDMSGVQRINSIGLRNFMMFLKAWNKGKYRFTKCCMEFIDQINLIPSILKVGGKGWVDSCETLVVCKGCGHEADIIVQMNPRPNKSIPTIGPKCSKCGGEYEPAVEGYFHFLQFLP